jgi:hypothetical protein
MFKQNRKIAGFLFLLAAAVVCLPLIFAAPQKQTGKSAKKAASDLEDKLARKADFVPSDKSVLYRLVAIAQHYEIPMGIEWINGSTELGTPSSRPRESYTVRDLLTAIVARLPDYQLTVDNGIVHIAPPVFAVRRENVLNLIIEEFKIENNNLYEANHELQLSVDMTLHPDEYEDGYVGGFGYGPDVLAKQNFSFQGDDLTVRQILDGLAKANGNALWIAEFDREDFAPKPKAAGPVKDKSDEVKPQWRFAPLRDK